ncbi:uncharacterized protein C2845_PM02G27710 [Panicum miliaceum]|uniref:VQ domain-containing protein n=1 Tax=Panicum miliaceum TaxID=4540 RepID=A0A3L6SE48_PANMI|nr:uncharacterized protein C2845_PM02G27710 [Panicum miliaceum]
MDAVSCVGVTPQGALLSRSFADAAIARALHFSLSDAPGQSAAAAEAATTAAPPAAAVLMHGFGGHKPMGSVAPSLSSPARCRLGPAGGHAGKRRRPRPSKRAPTTYISTDAATFRVMVQRVTGADESELLLQQQDGASGLGLLLPQLGVEQFLQAGPAAYTTAPPPAPAEQQPLFPTLDSWNVMYGKKNEVV